MRNIEVLDKHFNRLCFMDNSVEKGLHYEQDRLTTTIDWGMYRLEFLAPKTTDKVQYLKEGNYISFLNNQDVGIVVQIVSVEDDGGYYKRVECQDAALVLANSFADIIEKPTAAQTIDYYLEKLLVGTGFRIGRNECTGKALIGFDDANQSILARIRELMTWYHANFYISCDLSLDTPRFYINVVENRLEGDAGFRLSTDDVVEKITKRVDISNIITRLTIRGAEKTDATTPTVTSTAPVSTVNNGSGQFNDKKARLIQWFKDRLGRVTYSMSYRLGPNSYDCSSAVFYALIYAGYLPEGTYPGNTESLYQLENKLLIPISASEAKAGDIFVSGVKGASNGGDGHTGVHYGNNQIIHCNFVDNGISISGISGRTGTPLHWYRLKE